MTFSLPQNPWPSLVPESLFQSEALLVVVLDMEGRIQAISRGLATLLGRDPEDLQGTDWFDSVAPRTRYPEVWQAFTQLTAGSLPPLFTNPILTRSGEERLISWSNEPLTRDGALVGALSFGQDITLQARAAERTRQSHQILSRIFDTTHLCIAYLDPAFRFIQVNRAYADVCGYPPEHFPGKGHFDLYPHAENEAIFRQVVETGEPFTIYAKPFEFPDQPERGVTYWDWTLHPLKDARGHVDGLLFMLLDVTERKRMEAQLLHMQRMDALGQLAGGIAHDFNNLITAIHAFAGVGEGLAAGHPEMQEQFKGISEVAHRAAQLTRQLLAFARRQPLERQVLDLNGLVKGMAKMLRRLMGEGVELVFTPAPDLWPVKADPGQIEQVLMNLAVNARDAMPQGGAFTLELANKTYPSSPTPDLAPGDYLVLKVRDSGSGMPPEVAARAFEPFFTTKGADRGTGLGLATCHGIVRQHDGAILLDSRPGKGTRLTILLPRSTEAAPVATADGAPSARGHETILLVEDQTLVRKSVSDSLRALGYHVLTASHGDQALEVARRHEVPIQLAVVDMVLPFQGGEDVARQLRQVLPGLKVLLMSGYPDVQVPPSPTGAEAVDFLEKPFSPIQLGWKVRTLLDTPGPA